MGLLKPVRQSDGVTTNYHRILYMQSMINSHDSIAVLSYIDKESRDTEGGENKPYTAAIVYEKDYEENMTIEKAYEYLKTLPEFEGATDDI